MKKRITTLGLFAIIGATTLVYGQKTKGAVGINQGAPEATLDIKAYNSETTGTDNDTPEGILIPRISKKKAEHIGAKTKESTLVYITDNTNGSGTTYTSKVDAKGFYYFDGEWKKVGGDSGSGTKQNWEDIRTDLTMGVQTITANGTVIVTTTFFAIVNADGNISIKLPDASKLTNGKMVTVYKGGSNGNLQVQDNNGEAGGASGGQLVGNGAVRWSNGRTFIVANNKWYPTTF